MAKPTYQPIKPEDALDQFIESAEESRRAKGDPNPTIFESLTGAISGLRARRQLISTLEKQLAETVKAREIDERNLEIRATSALKAYANQTQFNLFAVYASNQFQQNAADTYHRIRDGVVEGKEIKAAMVKVSHDLTSGTANKYASYEAYVEALSDSPEVRKSFLPPQEQNKKTSRRFIPAILIAGALATYATHKGIDYGVSKAIRELDNITVPGLTHKMPPEKNWRKPRVTRKIVRDYLENDPDLAAELCPGPEPCPDCPELPAPPLPSATIIAPVAPSTTTSEPPVAPAEQPKGAKPFNPGYDTQALPGGNQ